MSKDNNQVYSYQGQPFVGACKFLKSTSYIVLLLLGFITDSHAQNETDERALIVVKDGIGISKDSLFLLNLRFRIQNRFGFNTVSGDSPVIEAFDARVRRMRLRLDGYVLNKKIQYYVQLSFSRADQDLERGTIAQTVRDAILYYEFSDRFYLGFGQSKLPGNRQRVISSGNLQFADRSIANGIFTLDRDFGFFGYYNNKIGKQHFFIKTALTSGEGRNALPINNGLNYTARMEWLPMGLFSRSGDYVEGDIEMEQKPKISIGATWAYNHKATRTGGQLGDALYSPVDYRVYIVDYLLKYQGFAFSGELFLRKSDDPITISPTGDIRFVFTGIGFNQQLSKFYKNNWEWALRYSYVQPDEKVNAFSRNMQDALLGVTKYFNGHRVKLQGNLGYRIVDNNFAFDHPGNTWQFMLQAEFGI